VRGLEHYELANGEVIVNVTAFDDIAEVTNELAQSWTWDSFQVTVLPAEEKGDGPTEWMTLIGAQRRVAAA
jgi:hypothetical protein